MAHAGNQGDEIGAGEPPLEGRDALEVTLDVSNVNQTFYRSRANGNPEVQHAGRPPAQASQVSWFWVALTQ
jgi:hypothetical protein